VEERKKLYKPINKYEIEEHARLYEDNLKEMEDILRRQRGEQTYGIESEVPKA